MKKFLALVIIASSVLFAPSTTTLADVTSYISDGIYVVYAQGYAYSPYAVRLDNGGDTVLKSDVAVSRRVYAGVDCVLGETVEFFGTQAELDRLVEELGFRTVIKGKTAGTYYGYSRRLGAGVNVDGKEINCQIVVGDGKITVGYPLIMGSYHLGT